MKATLTLQRTSVVACLTAACWGALPGCITAECCSFQQQQNIRRRHGAATRAGRTSFSTPATARTTPRPLVTFDPQGLPSSRLVALQPFGKSDTPIVRSLREKESLVVHHVASLLLPVIIVGTMIVGAPDPSMAAGSSQPATKDDIEVIFKKLDKNIENQGVVIKNLGVRIDNKFDQQSNMFFLAPLISAGISALSIAYSAEKVSDAIKRTDDANVLKNDVASRFSDYASSSSNVTIYLVFLSSCVAILLMPALAETLEKLQVP